MLELRLEDSSIERVAHISCFVRFVTRNNLKKAFLDDSETSWLHSMGTEAPWSRSVSLSFYHLHCRYLNPNPGVMMMMVMMMMMIMITVSSMRKCCHYRSHLH